MTLTFDVQTADPQASPEVSAIPFEIRIGAALVKCCVSGEALDAASGLLEPSTPALRRRSFDRFRTLIHQAAAMQFKARPPGCAEPVMVTGAALRRVPPQTGYPVFGTSGHARA